MFKFLLAISLSFSIEVICSNSLMISLFGVLCLYLGLSFVCFWLGLAYVGSVILLMYVSAVGILFLFVIMLLNDNGSRGNGNNFRWLISLLFFGFLLTVLDVGVYEGVVSVCEEVEDLNELSKLGSLLYGLYLWEVLVVGIVCIVIVLSVLQV